MKRELPAEYLLPSGGLQRAQKSAVSRLAPEQRGERQFVRVPMPFVVEHEGQTVRGHDLSIDGFALENPLVDAAVGEVARFRLRLLFKGYELTFNVEAHAVSEDHEGHPRTFRITEMDEAQREVLRKTIRAFLSGQLVTFEGLLLPSDTQTERQRRNREEEVLDKPEGETGTGLWQRYARFAAIGAGAVLLFGFIATSLFQRIAVTESRFATLTAPRIEIRAPSSGRLGMHGLAAGMTVAREQALVRVIDADLQAELAMAAAEQDRIALRLTVSMEDPAATKAGEVSGSPRGGLPIPVERLRAFEPAELAALDPVPGRADLELSRIHLAALEHRERANHLVSPCECEIAWSVPEGEWVKAGERVFSLIRTDPQLMSIVALVHMSEIGEIQPHDEAYVELPQTGELVAARVLAVRLDPDRGPRAGFPAWVAQDQSLASVELVPSRPLPVQLVGVPMNVYFTSWPVLARMPGAG